LAERNALSACETAKTTGLTAVKDNRILRKSPYRALLCRYVSNYNAYNGRFLRTIKMAAAQNSTNRHMTMGITIAAVDPPALAATAAISQNSP
jgi:hypothetical protein